MIVKNYFNPANNTELEGFDQTHKRQIDFSNLITTDEMEPVAADGEPDTQRSGNFDPRAKVFEFPGDPPLMIINEFGKTKDGRIIVGLPVPYQTYTTLLSKPY
jgi:hypothetical protein